MLTSRIWHLYSSVRPLGSALPLFSILSLSLLFPSLPLLSFSCLFRLYICQFPTGLPRPIRRQQGTGAQSISQSACKEELARKCQPIIELTGTRAKVGQSERLQEPRECRPIRAQRGTRAQSISRSACKEELARKVSANHRAYRNTRESRPIRALARPRECQPIRAQRGTRAQS